VPASRRGECRVVFGEALAEQPLGPRTVAADGHHREKIAPRAVNEANLRARGCNGSRDREEQRITEVVRVREHADRVHGAGSNGQARGNGRLARPNRQRQIGWRRRSTLERVRSARFERGAERGEIGDGLLSADRGQGLDLVEGAPHLPRLVPYERAGRNAPVSGPAKEHFE
jgi:hypothetical protein